MVSNTAFQLLAFALEKKNGKAFSEILSATTLQPLNMTRSSLLGCKSSQVFGRQDLNVSQVGEPAYVPPSDLSHIVPPIANLVPDRSPSSPPPAISPVPATRC